MSYHLYKTFSSPDCLFLFIWAPTLVCIQLYHCFVVLYCHCFYVSMSFSLDLNMLQGRIFHLASCLACCMYYNSRNWYKASLLFWKWKVKVKVPQSRPTLCNPMDFQVHGILQARIMEWVAMPSCRGSSQPRDRTQVQADSLPAEPQGKPMSTNSNSQDEPRLNFLHGSLINGWHCH